MRVRAMGPAGRSQRRDSAEGQSVDEESAPGKVPNAYGPTRSVAGTSRGRQQPAQDVPGLRKSNL